MTACFSMYDVGIGALTNIILLLDVGLVERLKFAQQIRFDHHPLFADLNKEAISEIKLRLCSDFC